jgi:hypothetical protein
MEVFPSTFYVSIEDKNVVSFSSLLLSFVSLRNTKSCLPINSLINYSYIINGLIEQLINKPV